VLTISGAGITNDQESPDFVTMATKTAAVSSRSMVRQLQERTLLTCKRGPVPGGIGQIYFNDTTSAGDATVVRQGALCIFRDDSTAADGTIIADASVQPDRFAFHELSNAGMDTYRNFMAGFIEIDGMVRIRHESSLRRRHHSTSLQRTRCNGPPRLKVMGDCDWARSRPYRGQHNLSTVFQE